MHFAESEAAPGASAMTTFSTWLREQQETRLAPVLACCCAWRGHQGAGRPRSDSCSGWRLACRPGATCARADRGRACVAGGCRRRAVQPCHPRARHGRHRHRLASGQRHGAAVFAAAGARTAHVGVARATRRGRGRAGHGRGAGGAVRAARRDAGAVLQRNNPAASGGRATACRATVAATNTETTTCGAMMPQRSLAKQGNSVLSVRCCRTPVGPNPATARKLNDSNANGLVPG